MIVDDLDILGAVVPAKENGVYHFDFKVTVETPVVIDPVVAVGYDYEVGTSDPLLPSVLLPELNGAPVTYSLWLLYLNDNPFDTGLDILSETILDFTDGARCILLPRETLNTPAFPLRSLAMASF